jgi:hypothetical protein
VGYSHTKTLIVYLVRPIKKLYARPCPSIQSHHDQWSIDRRAIGAVGIPGKEREESFSPLRFTAVFVTIDPFKKK